LPLLLPLLPIRLDGKRTTGFSRPLARSRRQHEDHVHTVMPTGDPVRFIDNSGGA